MNKLLDRVILENAERIANTPTVLEMALGVIGVAMLAYALWSTWTM